MKPYFAHTWTNLDKYARLFQNESRFSLSNSALSFWPACGFPLPCPDIDWGTLHLMVDPRLQPIPSFERWLGQINGHALSVVCKIRKASTTQNQIHFIFRTTEFVRAQVTWNVFLATYVPVISKLKHFSPGHPPPGDLNFWKIFVQTPPPEAEKLFKCPIIGPF